VSDEQYAAEKAAARAGPAPGGAIAIPVPESEDTGALVPTVVTNFVGLDEPTGGLGVPDTILGKSPTRAVEAVNSAVRLFNNTGGVLATRTLNAFFGAPSSRPTRCRADYSTRRSTTTETPQIGEST
jgi:hypothetical protein